MQNFINKKSEISYESGGSGGSGGGGAGEGNRKLECPLPLSHAQSLEGSTT